MLVLITGGSGSGKSEYAENTALSLGSNLIYMATMKPYGEEAFERISKHRAMRKHKGFKTLECYQTTEKVDFDRDSVVLLECMSNLVANEIFDNKNDGTFNDVINFVHKISDRAKAVVVVTNDVFCDGINYDSATINYIKTLGEINVSLANYADRVVEVVAGIPITIKEAKKCF